MDTFLSAISFKRKRGEGLRHTPLLLETFPTSQTMPNSTPLYTMLVYVRSWKESFMGKDIENGTQNLLILLTL